MKAIENLIAGGRYVNLGVIRCCHFQRAEAESDESLNRIMVSVPKKLFKRAVKRNLLKRRIREAYRLQKGLIAGCSRMDMMFVYNSKEVADFATIYSAVGAALEKIAAKHGRAGSKEAEEA